MNKRLLVIGCALVIGFWTLAAHAAPLEVEVSIDKVPTKVKATILKRSSGAKIQCVELVAENGKIAFDVEMLKAGKTIEFSVAPDGKYLGVKTDEDEPHAQSSKKSSKDEKKAAKSGKHEAKEAKEEDEEDEKDEAKSEKKAPKNDTKAAKAGKHDAKEAKEEDEDDEKDEAKSEKKAPKHDAKAAKSGKHEAKESKEEDEDDEKDEAKPDKKTPNTTRKPLRPPPPLPAAPPRRSRPPNSLPWWIKTFRKAYPKGKIEKLDVEVENGVTVYDLEFKNGSVEMETDIAADGTMLEFTVVIDAKQVPKAAMKAMKKGAQGAALAQIERTEISYETKSGKAVKLPEPITQYAAEYTKGKQTAEVTVNPDGTAVEPDAAAAKG